jgi:hypothetical protein
MKKRKQPTDKKINFGGLFAVKNAILIPYNPRRFIIPQTNSPYNDVMKAVNG